MDAALSASRSPQVEISAFTKVLRVVRFANSIIHQPMEERDVLFYARVLQDGKIGFASMNGLSADHLAETVKRAERNASLSNAVPLLPTFSKPSPPVSRNGKYEATWNTATDVLEEKVGRLIDRGKGTGVTFAGVFWTLSGELAVVNSNGVKQYSPWTASNCQTVATKGELSGFSAHASPDVLEINPEKIADAALHRALRFGESRELPPGDYPCLLSEYAAGELLFHLAYMTFTADGLEDGRSALAFKKGKRVADTGVTISDNALNPAGFSVPFDVEGVPKQRVLFVDQGIGKNVVYDLMYAHRFKTESTGHAVPFTFSEGPYPLHLEMQPGDRSGDELIKSVKRGLMVTRFHYIRAVHPLKTVVTGMTRDGVYLIENGEVVARVKNFRFTDSVLGAFSRVLGMSNQQKLVAGDIDTGFPSGVLAPKLLLEKFSFTGATQF